MCRDGQTCGRRCRLRRLVGWSSVVRCAVDWVREVQPSVDCWPRHCLHCRSLHNHRTSKPPSRSPSCTPSYDQIQQSNTSNIISQNEKWIIFTNKRKRKNRALKCSIIWYRFHNGQFCQEIDWLIDSLKTNTVDTVHSRRLLSTYNVCHCAPLIRSRHTALYKCVSID